MAGTSIRLLQKLTLVVTLLLEVIKITTVKFDHVYSGKSPTLQILQKNIIRIALLLWFHSRRSPKLHTLQWPITKITYATMANHHNYGALFWVQFHGGEKGHQNYKGSLWVWFYKKRSTELQKINLHTIQQTEVTTSSLRPPCLVAWVTQLVCCPQS